MQQFDDFGFGNMGNMNDFFGGNVGGQSFSTSSNSMSMGGGMGGGTSQSMSTKTYIQNGQRVTKTEKTKIVNGQRTTEVTEKIDDGRGNVQTNRYQIEGNGQSSGSRSNNNNRGQLQ